MKSRATSLLQSIKDGRCHPRQLFFLFIKSYCKISVMYFFKVLTKLRRNSQFHGYRSRSQSTGKNICKMSHYNNTVQKVSYTLSSIVSNLVSIMPSISLGLVMLEWSARAWLNLVSWSTASLPTRASPTNNTKSGWLTLINWKQKSSLYIVWYDNKKLKIFL